MNPFRFLRLRAATLFTVLVLAFALVWPLLGGGGEIELCGVTLKEDEDFDDPLVLIIRYTLGMFLAAGSGATAPLSDSAFEPNLGQFGAGTQFAAASQGWSFETGKGGEATLHFRSGSRKVQTVRLAVDGGAPAAYGQGEGLLRSRSNYILGRDPSKWATDVPRFAKVRYRGVYAGVDEIHSFHDGRIETDFEVQPGADPARIRVRIDGADELRLDPADGSLVMQAGGREVRWGQTRLFQTGSDGRPKPVSGRIRILSRNSVGFEVGDYDRSKTLVIDPVLNYLTYAGRNGSDGFTRIAADGNGNLYAAGATGDPTYPVSTGAFQQSQASAGRPNATLTKFNADGTEVLYTTHFGGSEVDISTGVTLDAAGNIYVTGGTNSPDFPVSEAGYQRTLPQSDRLSCFVMKLNPAGNRILYSTYLNGSGVESCNAIAVDSRGSVFVAGMTNSSNFPITPDAFQTSLRAGAADALRGFITKLNPAGSGLVYSTFLGGSSRDVIFGLAIDADGAAYVAGSTNSNGSFPVTKDAAQTTFGGSGGILDFNGGDGFAAKLSPDGTKLVYATYIGGAKDDTAFGITVDSAGAAYVTGATLSQNFPVTASSFQQKFGGTGGGQVASGDGFLVKLAPNGSAFSYATYLGGSGDERAGSVAVDKDGNAWVVGHTISKDFPVTADALQKTFGGSAIDLVNTGDGFIAKVNAAGSALVYSTYVGGANNEYVSGVAVSKDGGVVFAGGTASRNLPVTSNAAQKQGGTGEPALLPFGDGFAGRLSEAPLSSVSVSRVSNFGSRATGAVSPGMVILIEGLGMGPAETLDSGSDGDGVLFKQLAKTRVLFDGAPAALLNISATRIMAVVPYGVEGRESTQLVVENGADQSAPVTIAVVPAQPGLVTSDGSGVGLATATNEDGSGSSPESPAPIGSVVTLLATGTGQTDPLGVDGLMSWGETLPVSVLPVRVFFGGVEAEVVSQGAARNRVSGYLAVQVRIPEGLEPGANPVTLLVGEVASQDGVVLYVAPKPE